MGRRSAAAAPSATACWSSELNPALVTPMEDNVLELEYIEDNNVISKFLISKYDEEEDIFTPCGLRCFASRRGE